MNQDTEKTVVIFRMWQGVIALFPEQPASTLTSAICMSYMHIGQHGGADPHAIMAESRPASAEAYAPLKTELESLGYLLEIAPRLTPQMDAARLAAFRSAFGNPVNL